MRICEIEGCGNKHACYGLCRKHLYRKVTFGDPLKTGKSVRGEVLNYLNEVVFNWADKEACLIWPYYRDNVGYAIYSGGYKAGYNTKFVPNMICQKIHGPKPGKEYQAAHSCGQGLKGCVNPHHLRWLTASDNIRESDRCTKEKGICYIEVCGLEAACRGLCIAHYGRLRRHGSPLGGGRPRKSKGARISPSSFEDQPRFS